MELVAKRPMTGKRLFQFLRSQMQRVRRSPYAVDEVVELRPLDEKWRLVIPVEYRSMLGREFRLVCGPGSSILLMHPDTWESWASQQFVRYGSLAVTYTVEMDWQSGRILLPPVPRNWAGLEARKDVKIGKVGPYVVILPTSKSWGAWVREAVHALP